MKRAIRVVGCLLLITGGVVASWYGATSLWENHNFLASKYSPQYSDAMGSLLFLLIGLASGVTGLFSMSESGE